MRTRNAEFLAGDVRNDFAFQSLAYLGPLIRGSFLTSIGIGGFLH